RAACVGGPSGQACRARVERWGRRGATDRRVAGKVASAALACSIGDGVELPHGGREGELGSLGQRAATVLPRQDLDTIRTLVARVPDRTQECRHVEIPCAAKLPVVTRVVQPDTDLAGVC